MHQMTLIQELEQEEKSNSCTLLTQPDLNEIEYQGLSNFEVDLDDSLGLPDRVQSNKPKFTEVVVDVNPHHYVYTVKCRVIALRTGMCAIFTLFLIVTGSSPRLLYNTHQAKEQVKRAREKWCLKKLLQ